MATPTVPFVIYDTSTNMICIASPNGKVWQLTMTDVGVLVPVDTGNTV